MSRHEPLYPGSYYHLYNRGNSGETLFREERNYRYFLDLYGRYVTPVADIFAYCLLDNHFHLLLRMKEQFESWRFSRAFANLFSTYTKAFNSNYQRHGSLFEKPFKRRRIDSDQYLTHLVAYIHRNPQRHGFVLDFRDWRFSSYRALLSRRPTKLARAELLAWFGSQEAFAAAHERGADEQVIRSLIAGDG